MAAMGRLGRKQDWEEGECEVGQSPKMTLASQSWSDFSEYVTLGVVGWAFIPLGQSVPGCRLPWEEAWERWLFREGHP